MKRSGDVTAAAMVLLTGTGFLFLLWMIAAIHSFEISLLLGLPAIWGIATGIGILKLRSWARGSMVTLSITVIFLASLVALAGTLGPLLARNQPHTLASSVATVAEGMLVGVPVPFGVAVWWLVLFTRKRVATEFASRGCVAPSTQNGVTS
jgi:hypothetical protein